MSGAELTITFSENLSGSDPIGMNWNHVQFSVTVDGTPQTIVSVDPHHTFGHLWVGLAMAPPAGAVVKVSYNKDARADHRLRDADNNVLESFTQVVTVPYTREDVYAALKSYFSGTGTLAGVNRSILGFHGDAQSYHEALLEVVDEGRLDDVVPEGRTAWGRKVVNPDGTESYPTQNWGWGGEGFPKRFCYQFQGVERCIEDTSETWGWGKQNMCGGEPQPGFHENDYGDFFWACTPDGQWVPVRRHRPGVDYSHDDDLVPSVKPLPQHDAGRNDPDGDDPDVPDNQKCLFRDEKGNLAPLFRADLHPQDHPNPQLRGKPVRVNGVVQGTTIHGRNWDPIAKVCRGS